MEQQDVTGDDMQLGDCVRHRLIVLGQPPESSHLDQGGLHVIALCHENEAALGVRRLEDFEMTIELDELAAPVVDSVDQPSSGMVTVAVPNTASQIFPGHAPVARSQTSELWKRVFDWTLALLLIVVLLPLLALVALLIKATSPGPVIFRQIRVGQYGRPFVLCKFRTMTDGAERLLDEDVHLKEEFSKRWKLDDDPRITPLGRWLRKTSIDELPQLINVLRGEMSLVGPRPVQPAELEEHYGQYADAVFAAKPGLTGLWQVAGRSSVSYEDRIALDLEYVQRRCGWFDLVIMMRTIPAILSMRDAS